MNNLLSFSPACLFRTRLAAPKALVHALFLTGLLLGLFLLLPVNAEEDIGDLRFAPPPTKIEDDCPNCDNHLYLPLIAKKPFVITSGNIKLHTSPGIRARGLTIFDITNPNNATLDVSDLRFSYNPSQQHSIEVRVCCNQQWIEYPGFVPIVFADINAIHVGVNQVTVEFRLKQSHNNEISIIAETFETFTFFYIPNGDFSENSPNAWQLSSIGLQPPDEPTVSGKKLLLGKKLDNLNSCHPTKLGAAIAALEIEIPPHSDYILHIHGVVYTQDQNPSNTATYDAFEIAINGHLIERYSNRHPPIRCANPITRQIEVKKEIPLNGYAGQIVLSLENHLRYDIYFNTYTEIDMVWIDR